VNSLPIGARLLKPVLLVHMDIKLLPVSTRLPILVLPVPTRGTLLPMGAQTIWTFLQHQIGKILRKMAQATQLP
jgi:hypothetical protein